MKRPSAESTAPEITSPSRAHARPMRGGIAIGDDAWQGFATPRARRLRSLSPFLGGEGRGEGPLRESLTHGLWNTPRPNPLPATSGERELRRSAVGKEKNMPHTLFDK